MTQLLPLSDGDGRGRSVPLTARVKPRLAYMLDADHPRATIDYGEGRYYGQAVAPGRFSSDDPVLLQALTDGQERRFEFWEHSVDRLWDQPLGSNGFSVIKVDEDQVTLQRNNCLDWRRHVRLQDLFACHTPPQLIEG
jgi:hypothetical protein